MPVIIGVDEAGYGPNLGPLVVVATVWEVGDGIDCTMLYKLLRKVVASSVGKATRKRVVWADSKAVYKNGNGLDHLERGVLAALGTFGCTPQDWRELWPAIDWRARALTVSAVAAQQTKSEIRSTKFEANSKHKIQNFDGLCFSTSVSNFGDSDLFRISDFGFRIFDLPWHIGYSTALPLCCDRGDLCELSAILAQRFSTVGIRLIDVLARPVFPSEFNALLDDFGNKSNTLSRVTLELVAEALQSAPDGPVTIYCDKHGARNRYHAHLQTQFAEEWIEVRVESDEQSIYRFQCAEAPVEIGFWVCGEQFLPVALASMTAKYLREAAMRPFNEFWCARVPGLKPTAGYPNDAWRFKEQIAAVQQALDIDDRILWRSR